MRTDWNFMRLWTLTYGTCAAGVWTGTLTTGLSASSNSTQADGVPVFLQLVAYLGKVSPIYHFPRSWKKGQETSCTRGKFSPTFQKTRGLCEEIPRVLESLRIDTGAIQARSEKQVPWHGARRMVLHVKCVFNGHKLNGMGLAKDKGVRGETKL